ncbi:Fe/S biogenesis protein NfuA [Buchnera aphidicola (Cinara splendens)]|uniref:Fe/S biogenesis protein NfuA n=1 Tax=Buchnera aphidicola (Cinara splendens) TaxID=2518979 RepID=A0A451DET2_9GAMM|nr:NfuA family Fe-S biogenesis protein [Buchnera aphidicola]VFP85108.1 Fe/S biogenesis protein NfuA [Buchnera aphidicola (Cinara splendens)]
MITISDSAKQYILSLLSKRKVETNIRIFINSPGTMHAECGMSYCELQDIDSINDQKISFNEFDIYVHKSIVPFLKNSSIDLVKNEVGSQITLQAPYAKSTQKFRHKSQLENDVQKFLFSQVNPTLLLHGGSVNLINISSDGVVFLQFSGGCNGCSMISTTLKLGIEKQLMKHFSEISRVEDVTNHVYGQHSYY